MIKEILQTGRLLGGWIDRLYVIRNETPCGWKQIQNLHCSQFHNGQLLTHPTQHKDQP